MNKSFFEPGVYILFGIALSQLMYAFLHDVYASYAAASFSALLALTVIIFDLAGRHKIK